MVSTLRVEALEDELSAAAFTSRDDEDLTESVRELLVDGMRFRLLNNEPPIHRYFIERKGAEGVTRLYRRFMQATWDRVTGGDESARFRFAQVPAGGGWEALGVRDGWCILPKSIMLTPDGYRSSGWTWYVCPTHIGKDEE